MTHRVHNFGAGPAALPLAVLQQAREELLDFRGSGMSILESSHRGKAYSAVHRETSSALGELLGLAPGDAASHKILYMGGGARTQFGLVPMNLMPSGGRAAYVVTGRWAEMAAGEGAKRGEARIAWTSADSGFDRVPEPGSVHCTPEDAYLHYTSNNTVVGTQLREPPDSGDVPLISDMSSDLLSQPLALDRYGLIYAGAQKNLGPAGVTIVLVRNDLLERSPDDLPDTLTYSKMAAKDSLLNTPPVFAIYLVGLVARWLLDQGGLAAAAARSEAKAHLLYGAIDGSGGFYRGHAVPASRSWMNVTFRLPDEALEARFVEEAAAADLVGLKGHRSVGGIRASIYNAVALESVERLVQFMEEFRSRHG